MMTSINAPDFVEFLVRAKISTYAAGDAGQVDSSRLQSHDLAYREGRYFYLDTYLGGYSFVGEEAVWEDSRPIWGMNYYGTMVAEGGASDGTSIEIPAGFGDFLKLCLRHAPVEAPYRGPASFAQDSFSYRCQWEGELGCFHGEETIAQAGKVIYRLYFHGGKVV